MARRLQKEQAIQMRKEGKTYSEIIEVLNVPKGTLSDWLSEYPLTDEQLLLLQKNIKYKKLLGVERTTAVKHKKKQERLQKTIQLEKEQLLPLLEKELYLSGLFLYWGEGLKGWGGSISLNNTDPKVVKFYIFWLVTSLRIPKEKLKVIVHLYNDMDIEESLDYWSKELSLPRSQFIRPYIKKSLRSSLTQKGYGHGTCGIYVCNQPLKEKIMAGIQILADFYGSEVKNLI